MRLLALAVCPQLPKFAPGLFWLCHSWLGQGMAMIRYSHYPFPSMASSKSSAHHTSLQLQSYFLQSGNTSPAFVPGLWELMGTEGSQEEVTLMAPSQDAPSQGPEMPFPARGGEMLKATSSCTLGLPHLCSKVLPLWQGKIHPKEAPLQQVKNETYLAEVYRRWGSSWTCPVRCSRPGKRLTRWALLILLFLGMLQQWLWSRPTSEPGRRLVLEGPQRKRLCPGRVAGVPHPCWTLALVVFPSPGQNESAVKACLSSPILHFREHQMCSPARTGFAFCPWGLQANKPNLLLWRTWACQAGLCLSHMEGWIPLQ